MRNYGIVKPRNRSIFYGYHGALGKFEGIALIGKNTFFEVRTHAALKALTPVRDCPDIRMVMSEGEKLSKFWY